MLTTVIRNKSKNTFDALLQLCTDNGFVITEKCPVSKIIKGKKSSVFFWRNLYLELQMFEFMDDKGVIRILVKIFRKNVLKYRMEEKFIRLINQAL